MNFRFGILLFTAISLLFSAGFAEETAKKKSLWDSFTGFFSSKAEPAGDGELYQQLADIDNEIQETQWKYSRERRAVKKSYFKRHLEELHVSRDSLADVIQKQETAAAQKKSEQTKVAEQTKPSGQTKVAAQTKTPEQTKPSEQKPQTKPAEQIAPQKQPEPPKAEPRPDSVVVTMTVTKFVHDTVMVRDTVFVHDTVLVCDTLHTK